MSVAALEKRFADLQDRVNLLQDAANQLDDLIQRLATFNFQPGSVPLAAPDDADVASELADEINQVLREHEEDVELLREDVLDLQLRAATSRRHDKARLDDGVDRLGRELQRHRQAFRKAQITARASLREAHRRERHLLYASFAAPRSGAESPAVGATSNAILPTAAAAVGAVTRYSSRRVPPHASEMTEEERGIHANDDITRAMRNAHALMRQELTRSNFAHQTLTESTAALNELSDNYSDLQSVLGRSGALLGTLLKSQKTDTWYLQSALYLLLLTTAWLFCRRILWGPAWWLIYLPLKLTIKTVGLSVALTMGSRGNLNQDSPLTDSGVPQASMNNRDTPTMQMGKPSEELEAADRGGLLLNKIGMEIDGSDKIKVPEEHKDTVLRDRQSGELPNPKKRMMEDPSAEEERVKEDL
ncbi:Sec20-domain-containing protein [Xylariaceae sp. FL1272]|nr:Sec20-domain-containing protein [Xylariaceae sp. FL1272]